MSRWLEETGGSRGASYDEAFRELAASGADVHGEAAFVADLVRPGARVLDAGCGTGRVAVELARRGFDVVGVDNDASMLEVARRSARLRWYDADLAALELAERFDLVVAAGNVVVFLAGAPSSRCCAGSRRTSCPGGCSSAAGAPTGSTAGAPYGHGWPPAPGSSRSRAGAPGTASPGTTTPTGASASTARPDGVGARGRSRRRAARRRRPRARTAPGRRAPRRGR